MFPAHVNPTALSHRSQLWFVATMGVALFAPDFVGGQSEPTSQPQPAELIHQLGDPAYAKRQQAERQIRRLGPSAIAALSEAADGNDAEIALRADKILRDLRAEQFAHVKVQLSAKPAEAAWNEPVTLTVTFENPTECDAEIPLARPSAGEKVPGAPAAQVGRMLDLADYLIVTGPDGDPIELHLIDIREDPAVDFAVQRRVELVQGMVLKGGTTHEVSLDEFNRGWARYRMLRHGQYTVRFATPLAENGERPIDNQVVSNVVEIAVTKSAPDSVRSKGSKLSADLKQDGDDLVMRIRNRYDRFVYVHTMIGGAADRFAQLRWRVRIGDEWMTLAERPVPKEQAAGKPEFVKLAPGEAFVLLRKRVAGFWKWKALKKLPAGSRVEVSGVYANFYSRSVLRSRRKRPAQGRGGSRKHKPPLFVFSGSVPTDPVVITKQ